MTLAEAPFGEKVRVMADARTHGFDRALAGIGIHVGDEVCVVRAAPFHGPLLVLVPSSGVRVAVGRAMARSVQVERSAA
jgi:Fe2+ transport system protein FeoA